MKKLLAVMLMFALALGVVACSDKEEKKETKPVETNPTPTISDADALAATYAKGNIRWSGTADGKFTFDMPEKCDAPPCRVARQSGTYEIRRGKLYATIGGATQVWDFSHTASPRTLTISDSASGQSWTLSLVQ